MPTTFLSYCWDTPAEQNEAWVLQLATRLRHDGVEVLLDKWAVQPGDPIAPFMQRAIAQSNQVLIVCTPRYKQKADDATGSVGYEHNIISAQIWLTADHRKFITILKEGNDLTAVPTGLQGKYHIRLNDPAIFEQQYQLLLHTILNKPVPENQQPVSDRSAAALPVKRDFDNLSFAVLKTAGKQDIQAYKDFYRKRLEDNRQDATACFGLGVCYLHTGLYDLACRQLGRAAALAPKTAEYHYYYALALCRGKALPHLTETEAAAVLQSLKCAVALDNQQAKYHCFLLLLHYEYFAHNGGALPDYYLDEVLQKSRTTYRDEAEIERLAAVLGVSAPESIKLIFTRLQN